MSILVLVIRHANTYIVICNLPRRAMFSKVSHKRQDFPRKENKRKKKVIEHEMCNYVSNQQDAITFSFINLLIQPHMFRATNSPILGSTF